MNNSNINPDKPLLDIKDDLLGVAGLAHNMANNIIKMPAHDGFVIGLCGAWGSGKSTFINFTRQIIEKCPEKQKPLILDFNPWLFSGHDDLIQRYIIELSRALSPVRTRLKDGLLWITKKTGIAALFPKHIPQDISEQLIKFAGGLSSSSAITGAAIFANPALAAKVHLLGNLSKKAHAALSKQPPLAEQKKKICKSLAGRKKKILVVIDDIDRLAREEVLSIFRMVKSVADFPNVIYLLSFDRSLVCDIIKDIQNCDGADYLEKIVQYDIDLPQPDPQGVLKIFSIKVDPIIEDPQGVSFDQQRWGKVYMRYLREQLLTPRQAIKLGNGFCVSYPNLVGEVNPVDFIAIEAVRMFHPRIYEAIRRNPSKFVKLGQNDFNSEKSDKPFFQNIIDLADEAERPSVQAFLSELFPRIENAFSNFKMGVHHIAQWQAESRVCSEAHFGRYFSYSILPDKLSNAELMEAMELIKKDFKAFSELMTRYSEQRTNTGKTRIPEMLDRLLNMIKAGKLENALSNLMRAFIVSGDSLLKKEDEERGFLRIDTQLRIIWILLAAFERYQGDDLYNVVEQSFKQSTSIDIPVRLAYLLAREHGKYKDSSEIIRPGQPPYFTLDQVEALEAIALEKIRKAAKNSQLLNNPHMHSILYSWRDLTGKFDEPKAWVKKNAKTDEGLIRLVAKFSGISVISDSRGSRERISFQLNSLKDLLDIDDAYKRLVELTKEYAVKEIDLPIIKQFIDIYERAASGKADRWD